MAFHSVQWTGIPLDRTVTLVGLDSSGDISQYDILSEIMISAEARVDEFTPGSPIDTTQPVDFSIKAKMRTMYAIAASKNILYRGWGDQIFETTTMGGGTVALEQSAAGMDIQVVFTGI